MIPRKHLDIGLTDLIYAVASCLKREDRHKKTKSIITLTAYFWGIQDLKTRHQKPILPLELGLKKEIPISKETPMLLERIKIKMREQDVDFFEYTGKYEPTPLENKTVFVK